MKPDTIKKIVSEMQRKDRKSIKKILWRVVGLCCPNSFAEAYYSFNSHKNTDWNGHQAGLTLSFDCDRENDYRALPILLEKLGQAEIKASFACIGKWIEKNPEIHRSILESGHELINHTYTHPSNVHFHPNERFNQISPSERRDEIVKADDLMKKLLGYQPVGFRTPHFGDSHTEDVFEILQDIGYSYSSSTIAIQTPDFGMPYPVRDRLWEFPLSMDPKRINTCFDTYNEFNKSGSRPRLKNEKSFFNRLKDSVYAGIKTHSYINLYFDPGDIVLLDGLSDFIDFLKNLRNDLWIATYRDLVQNIKSTDK
jgi:peptidoglycan/xylan/chitin deacetylase (PgdA/CDA1 family)